MIRIAEEPLTPELIAEGSALLTNNWVTSGSHDPDIPLDPDYAGYLQAAKRGALLVVTLRVAGTLEGYAVLTMGMSRHHRTVRVALGEALYVTPAHRAHAAALMRAAVECVRKRGVNRMGWFVVRGHPVYTFLRHQGFAEDEVMMEKVL